MAHPKIQLLIFEGCPLAGAARGALQSALDSLDLKDFEEVDLLDADTPEELRAWGSPTILVDGEDVTGDEKGNGIGCRVYAGEAGVPDPAIIARAIRGLTSGHEPRRTFALQKADTQPTGSESG